MRNCGAGDPSNRIQADAVASSSAADLFNLSAGAIAGFELIVVERICVRGYFSSTVTVSGERSRTVIGEPDGNVTS
jgi:hypothetical protein